MNKMVRNLEILVKRAVRRLGGKAPGYFRVGKCRRCGECCRNLILYHEGKKIKTGEEFAMLTAEDPRYGIFYPCSISTEGILIFRCTKLGEKNTCTIYENRPPVCVDYPDTDLMKCGGDVYDGCGFYLVPPSDFHRVLKAQQKRKKSSF